MFYAVGSNLMSQQLLWGHLISQFVLMYEPLTICYILQNKMHALSWDLYTRIIMPIFYVNYHLYDSYTLGDLHFVSDLIV